VLAVATATAVFGSCTTPCREAVRTWQVVDQSQITCREGQLTVVAISESRDRLAFGCRGGEQLHLFDLKARRCCNHEPLWVKSVAYSGEFLVAGDYSGSIVRGHHSGPFAPGELPGRPCVRYIGFVPGTRDLVVGTTKLSVHTTEGLRREVGDGGFGVMGLAVASDSRTCIVVWASGKAGITVASYTLPDLDRIAESRLQGEFGVTAPVACSPDGRVVAVADVQGNCYVWRKGLQDHPTSLNVADTRATSLAWLRDALFVAGIEGGAVAIFDEAGLTQRLDLAATDALVLVERIDADAFLATTSNGALKWYRQVRE